MFARKNKVALTLLCLVVALGLATVSEANSLVHTPRDHAQLNRMIKKRAGDDEPSTRNPFLDFFQPVAGAGADPTASVSKVSDPASSASASSESVTDSASSASATGSASESVSASSVSTLVE